MNRDTEITLDQLQDAIVAKIAAAFPDLHVEAYREDRKGLPVPACLVELSELQAAEDLDPGTGQQPMLATFEAQLVIGFRQPGRNAKREIRTLAAALVAFTRLQRWGVPVGPAEVMGAWPDEFSPELDQYEVWRVEWQQVVHLGKSMWPGTGLPPSTVLAGYAPDIGADHAADYEQVAP